MRYSSAFGSWYVVRCRAKLGRIHLCANRLSGAGPQACHAVTMVEGRRCGVPICALYTFINMVCSAVFVVLCSCVARLRLCVLLGGAVRGRVHPMRTVRHARWPGESWSRTQRPPAQGSMRCIWDTGMVGVLSS